MKCASLVISIFLSLVFLAGGSASATLTGYNYYQVHNLTGQSGWSGNQANYPYYIDINSGTGTSSTGSSVMYLNGHSLNFPYDINFTSSDGNTLIPYVLEKGTGSSTQVRYWFNTTIYKTGNTSIYIYYGKSGNSQLGYGGNGASTFPMYDDFSYGTVTPSLIYHNPSGSYSLGTSTIVQLPNGTLMAAFGNQTTSTSDNSGQILESLSKNGYAWSSPSVLVDTPSLNDAYPQFIVNGTTTYLFYSVDDDSQTPTAENGKIYYIKSTDGGTTWGSPNLVNSSTVGIWGGQPAILTNGRVIVPFYYATSPTVTYAAVAYSDNVLTGGNTWTVVDLSQNNNVAEPTVAQLSGGTLVMELRDQAAAGHTYYSTSTDNGATWTTPAQSSIPAPASMSKLLPLSDGNVSLIWNNASARTTFTLGVMGSVNSISKYNNINLNAPQYGDSNFGAAQASDGRILIATTREAAGGGSYNDVMCYILTGENSYLYPSKSYSSLWTTGSGTLGYQEGSLTGVTAVASPIFGTGYAVMAYAANPNAAGLAEYLLSWADSVSLNSYMAYRTAKPSSTYYWTIEKSPTTVTTPNTTAASDISYHRFSIGQISTTSYFTRDGISDGSLTSSPTTATKVVDYQTSNLWQYVAVRPYVTPEPAQGDWQTEQSQVSIPVAISSLSRNTLQAGGFTYFNDTSLNSPTARCWTFGEGGYAATANGSYTYERRGVYNVSSNVSNSAGYNISYNIERVI